MNTEQLKKQFESIGANLYIRTPMVSNDPPRRSERFTIDTSARGDGFVLTPGDVQFEVVATDNNDSHLLLMAVMDADEPDPRNRDKRKFLCGRDERNWFVAGVRSNASSIKDAKESLKPDEAMASQRIYKVSGKHLNSRKNKGFTRQGEWFFIPEPDLDVNQDEIHRVEPLRMGGKRAHMAEELFRSGGTSVRVCSEYPNGVTESEYKKIISEDPGKATLPWRYMVRDAGVWVRGKIRHPDHNTINLKFWHRVLPSREVGSSNVAFLD